MQTSPEYPIRLTVCDNAQQVRHIISELQNEGFSHEEIGVVCSMDACEREFKEFIHQHPGEEKRNDALNKSGLAALGMGAAAVAAGLLTTAGTAVAILGVFFGAALTGTFAALMVTRGAEKEVADYYDQAITSGKIIVAVETEDVERQKVADRILSHGGGEQTALPRETPNAESIS
ncbi:hypothetical protein KOR42_40830 [Thalassoglobus neptunius]|uniref:General stress protein 17M-like domain-containing protein n=1 Tax=Thalassoglobus neptunius TaxID=1938619 RepID=A0A5C5WCT4_9PLAN|nr:hypothetical protein [Thalassoglobus neptunius]TWT47885.1 hypothetical protein KOR42_40830 [Thalassoglobus neptunius]